MDRWTLLLLSRRSQFFQPGSGLDREFFPIKSGDFEQYSKTIARLTGLVQDARLRQTAVAQFMGFQPI